MARKEERIQASVNYVADWYRQKNMDINQHKTDVKISCDDFVAGAEWADQNPDKNKVYTKKELYDMGFSFTLNNDIVSPKKLQESCLEYSKKKLVEKACRIYCDDICTKGMCGMCYHKHDGKQQVLNNFKYNECNELQLLRREMEE